MHVLYLYGTDVYADMEYALNGDGVARSFLKASLFIAGGVHAEALGVTPGDTPDLAVVAALYEKEGEHPTHAVPFFRW